MRIALFFAHLAILLMTKVVSAEVCIITSGSGGNWTMVCPPDSYDQFPNSWTGFSEKGQPCSSPDGGATAPCQNDEMFGYGWSISSSVLDPDVCTGELGEDTWGHGWRGLFLWLRCLSPDPEVSEPLASTANFGLASDLPILAVYPFPTWLAAGTSDDLVVENEHCVHGPEPVAFIWLDAPTVVGSVTWGKIRAQYRKEGLP